MGSNNSDKNDKENKENKENAPVRVKRNSTAFTKGEEKEEFDAIFGKENSMQESNSTNSVNTRAKNKLPPMLPPNSKRRNKLEPLKNMSLKENIDFGINDDFKGADNAFEMSFNDTFTKAKFKSEKDKGTFKEVDSLDVFGNI